MKKEKVTATEEDKGLRIDQFLSQRLEDLSRNQARKALQRGGVYLGRKRIKICSYRIKGHENITIYYPKLDTENAQQSEQTSKASDQTQPIRRSRINQSQKQAGNVQRGAQKANRLKKEQVRKPSKPSPIPPERQLTERDIIYCDEYIVALNKKNGIPSQATRSSDQYTAGKLLEYYLFNRGENQTRVNLIHRLDQNSSGIMIFSRNKQANVSLTEQFRKHLIQKSYLAIVCGSLEQDKGEIRIPLDDERKNPGENNHTEKDAITQYEVLERFKNYIWLKISPKTGRKHQIRRHFSQQGLPLLGDTKYSGLSIVMFNKQFLYNDLDIDPHRFLLHSYSIGFEHPKTKMRLELTAPIPDDMKEVLNLLRNL